MNRQKGTLASRSEDKPELKSEITVREGAVCGRTKSGGLRCHRLGSREGAEVDSSVSRHGEKKRVARGRSGQQPRPIVRKTKKGNRGFNEVFN